MSLSSQPSTEKGKRFLKNKASVAVDSSSTVAAVRSPNGSDVGLRSRSRAAHASAPLLGLDTKSVNVKSIVGLESDEEDMRKLLNDSLDSTQDSFAKSSLMRTTDKVPFKLSTLLILSSTLFIYRLFVIIAPKKACNVLLFS